MKVPVISTAPVGSASVFASLPASVLAIARFLLSLLLLLLLLAAGCASDNAWQAEEIPLPRTTPFDSNAFARNAYLDGFRTGYRSQSSGLGGPLDLLAPPNVHARRLGYQAGVNAARSQPSDRK